MDARRVGKQIRPGTEAFALMLLIWALMVGWGMIDRPVAVANIEPAPTEYRIAINSADWQTLQLLPGIGPSIARNIVAYREQHGPFVDPAALEGVRQIGPGRRERLMPWIDFRADGR